MQTQSHQSETLTQDPDDGEPRRRPGLRAVPAARSRRVFRMFGVGTAALVATGGYVHFCLYRHGYSSIPKIGVGFALQVVSSVLVVALLLDPHVVARIAHVTDRTAATLTGLAAAGLATGTLVAFVLTRTPGGLFNFQERGLQPSPQALIALLAESGVLVVVGAWLLSDQVARHRLRTAGDSAV
jgi:hypothetical protein